MSQPEANRKWMPLIIGLTLTLFITTFSVSTGTSTSGAGSCTRSNGFCPQIVSNILGADITMTNDCSATCAISTGYGVIITLANDARNLVLSNLVIKTSATGTYVFRLFRCSGSCIPAQGAAATGTIAYILSFDSLISATGFTYTPTFYETGLTVGNTYSYYWTLFFNPAGSPTETIVSKGSSLAATIMVVQES